jgi:hypothetical protein
MPQTVLSDLRRILVQTKIFLMYGLTEAFRSTYLSPEELDRGLLRSERQYRKRSFGLSTSAAKSAHAGEVRRTCTSRTEPLRWVTGTNPELTRLKFRPHPFPNADAGSGRTGLFIPATW